MYVCMYVWAYHLYNITWYIRARYSFVAPHDRMDQPGRDCRRVLVSWSSQLVALTHDGRAHCTSNHNAGSLSLVAAVISWSVQRYSPRAPHTLRDLPARCYAQQMKHWLVLQMFLEWWLLYVRELFVHSTVNVGMLTCYFNNCSYELVFFTEFFSIRIFHANFLTFIDHTL